MALRVIVGYTGGVGSALIRLVLSNPAYELVGVLVHSEEKDGKDAGHIVGRPACGVIATRDPDALVALGADVLSWHGLTWQPEVVARFLRAGTSVYSSMGGWFLPNQPEYALVTEAAIRGNAALVAGGNIPGLVSDVLPLFASGYSANVSMVRAWQADHVPNYPSAFQLQFYVGFGRPIPDEPFDPTAELSEADHGWLWGVDQSARIVAQGLGIPFEATKITDKEFAVAPADITLHPSGLEIAQGTALGVRWTFTAYSAGVPFYEVVNEQTGALGLGTGWRQSQDEPNWRVRIDGAPTVEATFTLPSVHDDPDHVATLNAARALNFLPRVAAAAPGWRTVLDIPAPVGTYRA
jgi:2,4-diaminopentanoate dehydrogenase